MNQSNIYEYLQTLNSPKLIICRDDKEAIAIRDVANLLEFESFVLPDIRVSVGEDLRPYDEEIRLFLSTLAQYHRSEHKKVLISPARTTLLPFPVAKNFALHIISFADRLSLASLKEQLYYWGYHFTDIVATAGEVSFRGDIIDIFPIDAQNPYRIGLFDNEVESIHRYDPMSQKRITPKATEEELESMTFSPAFLALDQEAHEILQNRVKQSRYDSFIKDIDALGLWHLGELGKSALEQFEAILACNIDAQLEEIYCFDTPLIPREAFVLPLIPESKQYKDLEVVDHNKLLKTHKNKTITIIAKNQSIVRGSALEYLEGITFVYQEGIVNLVGKDKLILSLNKPVKAKKVKKASIILDELKVGDYIVHENHGVGIFKGIEKRDVLGATSEFVVIRYLGEDVLLIPVSNLEVIDRFVAESGTLPSIDRLGKTSFKKLKTKVREKLFAIASQIIALSAQRHLKRGITLEIDKETLAVFMAKAGFLHTEDQERAVYEMLEDMQSGRIMDRLLSADVGFGKTEVAMNAMFVAASNGYQSMIIAPTTLLSSQHYKSLKARFSDEKFKVAKLDRFSSTKEKHAVLEGLKSGTIDMVIGTHALLGATFKKLALVVIDEEHKFGVKQKEALKEISTDVHLLSMSATPIPRSLNLAMSQVKSFSEILTPPTERQGVRTFVKNYDEKIIKEAILREQRRGGQVFYVFNSIAGIEDKKKTLLSLLPTLRIAVLHSQISAKETEDEMMKFEEGKYDLLLSTSIVESGIHMPHANTMIVEGADRFGIADLHQLRGRVGRGSKEGYAYFIVKDTDALTEQATKRLLALESHSDLGSGAVLAFHDLEIRGGGNIIGEAQSGHIKQIGYSLYLRMLEDAIKELSGQEKETTIQVDMKLSINAYLNEELISEDRLRLELYRRLSHCESIGDVYEIGSEIEDRFGRLDTITKQFIDVMAIKVLASQRGVCKVSSYYENIFIEFSESNKERITLKSPSRDDDDIIATAMKYLKTVKVLV